MRLFRKAIPREPAIDFILKHFGLELDDAYIFGDSSNDLAMFTYGKHTVALGHHDPVLDPYTEYVTDTVENDGLMKAMAHYGLIWMIIRSLIVITKVVRFLYKHKI